MSKSKIKETIFSLLVIFLLALKLWGNAILEFITNLFWITFFILLVVGIVFFVLWLRKEDYI